MLAPAAPVGGSSVSRNPFSRAARAIGSCFGRRPPPPDLSEDLKPSPSEQPPPPPKTVLSSSSSSSSASSTSTRSTYGSSRGSAKGRSGRGILNSREFVAQAQPQPGSMRFSMAEIHRATKNFSQTLKIGHGGFGTVYRGTLHDGMVVAVKRAKKGDSNNHLGAEFQSEIKMLARIEHLNLVRFYGYLEHEDERIIVVEYVPNGTLREHLDCVHRSHLDLAARLDIAIDVAHAVTYLHMYTDHPIIHRDIKSSNILLTENLRAKVADFGLARLGATGVAHVSTQVKGTAGYLDPEYLRTCQLTEKSDVYSFGVLLVELMSGRRPIEPKRERKERITPKWAMKKFMDGMQSKHWTQIFRRVHRRIWH
ncbi:calmodulin-binding receptor-like cytoplasmic kinase 2 [Iris pallida]|uniref:Calmodulin-binding receptor-like cytoplasmic kinase 2 n=1 Tax=Iris pallida TaxID=29817 RepID=A0AAX6G8E7_IRIPA|nr:calmodulin-binding receptor-like cytoplasmic kinase 2 [Iris pallida]